MRRVAVLGCGGAGKTTLARELGRRLQLPTIHADSLLLREQDAPPTPDEWASELAALLAGDAWVVDTAEAWTIESALARVETAVVLDLPRRSCYAGLLLRRLANRGRADPAAGIVDRVDLDVVRWIWRFRSTSRPQILELLAQNGPAAKVVVLRSRREVQAFLDSLPQAAA